MGMICTSARTAIHLLRSLRSIKTSSMHWINATTEMRAVSMQVARHSIPDMDSSWDGSTCRTTGGQLIIFRAKAQHWSTSTNSSQTTGQVHFRVHAMDATDHTHFKIARFVMMSAAMFLSSSIRFSSSSMLRSDPRRLFAQYTLQAVRERGKSGKVLAKYQKDEAYFLSPTSTEMDQALSN